MKSRIFILSGVLAAQLLLAGVLNLTGEEYGAFQAEEKLLSFDRQAVSGLRIEDGTDSVMLKKQEGQWLLPGSGDFPASQRDVGNLLDNLAALQKGWPVARTRAAARRFSVDEDQFERKITLLADDDTRAILFVGSSPGFRKVYVRPGDGNEIFAVAFNTWEADAKADGWIDKDILKLDESEVERIEMPGLILQRQDGELQVADLSESEQTSGEERRSLLARLTGLRIQSLLGTDAKPEYRQDEPTLEFTIMRRGGEVLSYRFSKPEDAAYYVLKRSDMEVYFKVAEYTIDPVRDTTREKLVQDKTEETSSEAAENKPDAKVDNASAAQEQ